MLSSTGPEMQTRETAKILYGHTAADNLRKAASKNTNLDSKYTININFHHFGKDADLPNVERIYCYIAADYNIEQAPNSFLLHYLALAGQAMATGKECLSWGVSTTEPMWTAPKCKNEESKRVCRVETAHRPNITASSK